MTKMKIIGLTFAFGFSINLAFAQKADLSELPETKFNYVGAWSSVLLYKQYESNFWGTHIEKASNGKITADVTSFDQLGIGGDQVFRLLQKGLFDVGTTLPDYVIQDVPAMGGVDIPALTTDAKTAKEASMAFKPVLAEIMRENYNAELLAIAPNSRQAVYCRDSVSGLKDLAGRKIRAGGRYEAIFLKAIGAEGITMSFSEVPGAMENGLLDCAITGIIGGYNAGWHEIADYVYTLPIGGWDHAATAVNGDVWDALDPRVQTWLKAEINEYYEKPAWDDTSTVTINAVNCLTGKDKCIYGESGQMILVEPNEEDINLTKKILIENVLPEWAKATDNRWVQRWNETIGVVTGIEAPL